MVHLPLVKGQKCNLQGANAANLPQLQHCVEVSPGRLAHATSTKSNKVTQLSATKHRQRHAALETTRSLFKARQSPRATPRSATPESPPQSRQAAARSSFAARPPRSTNATLDCNASPRTQPQSQGAPQRTPQSQGNATVARQRHSRRQRSFTQPRSA